MKPQEQLCNAGRRLEQMGLSPGASGNLSIRSVNDVFMSPTNTALGSLQPDELSRMRITADGLQHIDGPKPSKEYGLHFAMYKRDAKASAVVHVHSAHAVAASCLPPWSEYMALPPLTPYVVMRVGNVPLIPYCHPGDPHQAMLLLEHSSKFHAALLQNHGPIAAGSSLAEAITRTIEIESAARTWLLLSQHPDARVLTGEQAYALASVNHQPWY